MKKNPAAVALGRKGGAAGTKAQNVARRANGRLGGRPLKMKVIKFKLGTLAENMMGMGLSAKLPAEVGQIEVHPDVILVGHVSLSRPALLHTSPAAYRWLKRHGYRYASWNLIESFEDLPQGRCWSKP